MTHHITPRPAFWHMLVDLLRTYCRTVEPQQVDPGSLLAC